MCKSIYLLLFVFTCNFSYSQNASKSINKALEKAKKENKHVFVNYLTANCNISDNMKSEMKNDLIKSVFDANYIVVNIEVPKEETSNYLNCSNPVKSFTVNNCEEIKFPFWFILDTSGNTTYNSYKDDKTNIGYPVTKRDMNLFIEVIQKTSKVTENKGNNKERFVDIALN